MMVGVQEVDVAGNTTGTREDEYDKRLLKCPLDLHSECRKHWGSGRACLEGTLEPLLPPLMAKKDFFQLFPPSMSDLRKTDCREAVAEAGCGSILAPYFPAPRAIAFVTPLLTRRLSPSSFTCDLQS